MVLLNWVKVKLLLLMKEPRYWVKMNRKAGGIWEPQQPLEQT